MIGPVLGLAAMTAVTTPGMRGSSDAVVTAAADTTVIEIYTTNAALAFDPDLIRAKAGSIVKIRYVNESALAHNLVILKSEKDLDVVGQASFHAAGTGFVPMEHKAKMIAYSPLANAGKTVEFTFTVPPVGDYLFACFVDGHFNMMIGKLRSYKPAAEK
jgi:plastocyanin